MKRLRWTVAVLTWCIFTQAAVAADLGFPLLPGYSRACEENPQIARAAAAMTPPTARLLTCLIETGALNRALSGGQVALYPMVMVSQIVEPDDHIVTASEFEQLRTAARTKLAGMVDGGATRAEEQMHAEDKKLASQGQNVQRDNYRVNFTGFFDSSDASFSYLTQRQIAATVSSTRREISEINAVTVIRVSGKLVVVNVILAADGDGSIATAKELTRQWLNAFWSQNRAAASAQQALPSDPPAAGA